MTVAQTDIVLYVSVLVTTEFQTGFDRTDSSEIAPLLELPGEREPPGTERWWPTAVEDQS